jgi:hypothetical protein
LHESIAVRVYTNNKLDIYWSLNLALRLNKLSAVQERFVEILDRALSKLPVFDGVVFRGIVLGPAQLAAVVQTYKAGGVFEWRAFSSASMLLSKAYGANVYFAIRSKRGRVLGSYSSTPRDNEVLFASGGRFRVLSCRGARPSLWFVDVEEIVDGS